MAACTRLNSQKKQIISVYIACRAFKQCTHQLVYNLLVNISFLPVWILFFEANRIWYLCC